MLTNNGIRPPLGQPCRMYPNKRRCAPDAFASFPFGPTGKVHDFHLKDPGSNPSEITSGKNHIFCQRVSETRCTKLKSNCP